MSSWAPRYMAFAALLNRTLLVPKATLGILAPGNGTPQSLDMAFDLMHAQVRKGHISPGPWPHDPQYLNSQSHATDSGAQASGSFPARGVWVLGRRKGRASA